MKKRLIVPIGIAALVAVLVTACGLVPFTNRGTLVLNLSSQPLLTARTIVPGLDMEPAYFDIYGTGPGGASFEQLGLTGSSTAQAALIPGEWLIRVEAYNADVPAALIGTGEAAVTVVAGQVATIIITIEPLSGVGILDVTVTWPEGVLISPIVEGVLTPLGGTGESVAFVTAADELSAAYLSAPLTSSEALPTGYYSLSLWLSTERADGTGRDTVWGTVEAVRILADQTSSEIFELIEDVNHGGIIIETELDNPFEVTISGVDPQVLAGATIIAEADPAGADSYEWYLDGMPLADGATISITDNEITITGGIGIGHHWLSVVVTSGSVMSSTSVEFDVVRELVGSSLWGAMVWNYDVWG